jgi:hypothetical protein
MLKDNQVLGQGNEAIPWASTIILFRRNLGVLVLGDLTDNRQVYLPG